MRAMGKLALTVTLLALLAAALWFAVYAWNALPKSDIPDWGYAAMGGGIFFSLLVGCGLMALVFYSSRHGYDDAPQRDDDDPR